MNDTTKINGSSIEITPLDAARTQYRRAAQRLAQMHQRKLRDGGTFDQVKVTADLAIRACEVRALVNQLIAIGLIDGTGFYRAAAMDANERADEIQTQLDTPKLIVPGSQ